MGMTMAILLYVRHASKRLHVDGFRLEAAFVVGKVTHHARALIKTLMLECYSVSDHQGRTPTTNESACFLLL